MATSPDGRHHERALELGRRNAGRVTPRYRSLVLHWLGRWLRRPRPVSPAPLEPVEPGQVAVTWGGHATALVRYQRLSVLCDPMLGGQLRGIRREVAPGIGDEALAGVDLVLVSNPAPGHLHLPSLARLPRTATVVVPPRAAAQVSALGFARLVELAAGHDLEHRGVQVVAAPVRHGGGGAPAQSYVLRGDGPSVYFCGASGYFAGFRDIGRDHRPDVALLPIAGYWPPSFRERHMSPIDALYALEDLGSRVMVPIAHGTFALSYELMHDPERWLASIVAQRGLDRYVAVLEPGEVRVFAAPASAQRSGRAADHGAENARTSTEPLVAATMADALATAVEGWASGETGDAPVAGAGDAGAGDAGEAGESVPEPAARVPGPDELDPEWRPRTGLGEDPSAGTSWRPAAGPDHEPGAGSDRPATGAGSAEDRAESEPGTEASAPAAPGDPAAVTEPRTDVRWKTASG